MPPFKDTSFQERTAVAAAARAKALAQLRARPVASEAELAEARARRIAREAADAEKRAAARASRDEAEAQKRARSAGAVHATEAAVEATIPELSEAERKAARDARYAARKMRKSSR